MRIKAWAIFQNNRIVEWGRAFDHYEIYTKRHRAEKACYEWNQNSGNYFRVLRVEITYDVPNKT